MTSTRSLRTTAAGLAFGQSRFARWLAPALRAADRMAPQLAVRLAVNLFFTPLPTKLASRHRVPAPWRLERCHTGHESFTLLRHCAEQAAPRPRVLLVHGWAGDALQMRALGDAVAAAGFEPVLMDLPAHGRSAGWRCTMPQIVRSLQQAASRAGPFDAVVAHSMGAVASLHAMASGLLSTQRLVALAPSSTPESVLHWFGETFGLNQGLIARMRARIEAHEQMALEQFEAPWLGARVNVPVLLVHDRGDRMAPISNSEALAHALLAAQFHATEGLSHRRILSDPHVIEMTLAHVSANPVATQ
jgi:pimeloyl-ACP methyl ester carboxylesterase